MPSSRVTAVITAVRALFVVAGVAVAAATVYKLATMPPPPPNSDGFAHGMAALFGSVLIVLSLGVAAVSVVLPTVLGFDDPVGFNRWQRLALKGAGVLVGGGFLLSAALAFTAGLQWGIILFLLFVALTAVVVGATLVWRVGAALVRLLSRAASEESSRGQ
ncbi:MAG: hypothetical protein ABEJ22_09555 [Haloferacaceae archaeon]